MLITLSHNTPPSAPLTLSAQDAILLWQSGVTLPLNARLEYLSENCQTPCFTLHDDVLARGLLSHYRRHFPHITLISMAEMVQLTERYFPQLAL